MKRISRTVLSFEKLKPCQRPFQSKAVAEPDSLLPWLQPLHDPCRVHGQLASPAFLRSRKPPRTLRPQDAMIMLLRQRCSPLLKRASYLWKCASFSARRCCLRWTLPTRAVQVAKLLAPHKCSIALIILNSSCKAALGRIKGKTLGSIRKTI